MTDLEELCTTESHILLLDEEGNTGVCVGGRYHEYLMRRHADGYWVTTRKLEAEDPREAWKQLLPAESGMRP